MRRALGLSGAGWSQQGLRGMLDPMHAWPHRAVAAGSSGGFYRLKSEEHRRRLDLNMRDNMD